MQDLAAFVLLGLKARQDTVLTECFNLASRKHCMAYRNGGEGRSVEIGDWWGGPFCPQTLCTGSRYFSEKINKASL